MTRHDTRARTPIARMRAARLQVEHHCVWCGRLFLARPDAMCCSPAHTQYAWRAVVTLAGTHGWVNGQFARLPT